VDRVRGLLRGEVSAVGGVVRDALLGAPPGPELDLVVEGDAIALAERLGRSLGARVAAHPRFGTATIELPHHEGHLDLVSARTERYAAPGALPSVAPGSLADDLARRDFTINAMALGLSGAAEGELVDPHGGVGDLDARVVRAIRGDAFEEDPSRLVRAARYAERLGFELASETELAARAAAPALDPGSARVADELRRLLDGPRAAAGVELLRALGVPWLAPRPFGGLVVRFDALDSALARPGAPAVPAWPLRMGEALPPEAVARAAVPGWARGLALEVGQGMELAGRLARAARPSELDRILRAAPPAAAVAALAEGAEAVAAWWADDRDRHPAIRGADLVEAGVPPGPAIGRALAEVRDALLDGRVGDRDEQLAMALRVARGGP